MRHAAERGVDGVICGHIHAANIRRIDGITYINCGDWVDSCTAVVEHHDGRMELVHWGLEAGARATQPPRADPTTERPGTKAPVQEPA